MATDFKYAAQSDLEMYYPNASQYDAKRQILGWETTDTTNQYQANNTGLITQLYFDGIEGTSVSDNPDANYEFNYSSSTDSVQVFISTAIPIDMLMEGGIDNATYFDQMLVNASFELNNLLDARYPMPLPKFALYDSNTASASVTPEYDAIIIKATCYICVSNLLKPEGKFEEADYYYNQVTNVENTGIADKLNAGIWKLSFEVTADDSKGQVRTISKAGTMDIVETSGAYVGEPFDILRITCSTAGVYGVAKVKVEYYGSDKLFGQESDPEIVTGGLQTLSGLGGMYVRFQGSSMNLATTPDQWEIEFNIKTRKITNAGSSAIELTRTGYGI